MEERQSRSRYLVLCSIWKNKFGPSYLSPQPPRASEQENAGADFLVGIYRRHNAVTKGSPTGARFWLLVFREEQGSLRKSFTLGLYNLVPRRASVSPSNPDVAQLNNKESFLSRRWQQLH